MSEAVAKLSQAVPARPDLEPFLKGKQFGIGTPQGGLATSLSIRARLAAHPDHVVASLDFKNAFGTLQRSTCMDTLRRLCPHCPAWLDVVNIILARPTVINNPTADKPSKTWDGLPQGDPLSTLLFSTVMSELVSQVCVWHHLRGACCFLCGRRNLNRPGRRDYKSLAATPQFAATFWPGTAASQNPDLGAALRVPPPYPSSA